MYCLAGAYNKTKRVSAGSRGQDEPVFLGVRDDLAKRLEIYPGEAGPSTGKVQKRKRAPKKAHRSNTTSKLTTLKMGAKETKLVIFGHSWVERLEKLGIMSFTQDGREIEVKYVHRVVHIIGHGLNYPWAI